MARQRLGKTYLSAIRKAEMEAAEEGKEEEKEDKEKNRRHRRRRRPPPRFSDLFIKKTRKGEEEISGQSKENISLFGTGAKAEEMFSTSHSNHTSRIPLGVNNNLTNSIVSGPSFSDTFDKLFSKPSGATQPQIPKYLCSSSFSDGILDNTGVLFKSLVSTLATDISTSWSNKLRNRERQTQENNNKMKPDKEHNESPIKESLKASREPLHSPQLFTSIDLLVDKDNEASENPSPQPKRKIIRHRIREKQPLSSRQRVTRNTRNTSKTECMADVQGREPPTNHLSAPKVQPFPMVQRFLNTLGINCTPPVQSNSLHLHQNTKLGSPPILGKSSGKSSIHTSTPTERSKWSGQGSPSLEIRVSPVPREEEIVTDNSSDFQSPSPPTEGKRGQSQGDLGGSPSLPSKYESCVSSEQDTNQHYVTGETCDSDKEDKSPSYDEGSIRISHGMFKGAKIPKITFESPPKQEPPSHHTDSSTDHITLNTEPSIIITRRTRAGKSVKRLESSQSSCTTLGPKVFITRRNEIISPWLAKRFSPKVTRSRSRLLEEQSDESHNADISHFKNSFSSSCASEAHKSWGSKGKKNIKRGNMLRRKSKRITAQKTDSVLDSDESNIDFLPPVKRSQGLEKTRKQKRSIIPKGVTKASLDLPPKAKSVKLSRKRNPAKVSAPTRRSTRLLLTHDLTASTNRSSNKTGSSFTDIPSDYSSIINFKPRRGRRNNQFIFHRRSPSLTSVDSLPDGSHSEPSAPSTSTKEAGGNLDDWKDGGGATGLREAVVMVTRLEESTGISRESVGAYNPLPPLPVKPGKGWRRSIAIRARAASLASAEELNVMPAPNTPTRTQGLNRKMSGLRISSFPLELNNWHHQMGSSNIMDSPRRSVLQMSFYAKEAELSLPPTPAPDPRQKVMELCSQVEPLPITHCFTESRLTSCRKIGEGVYGEVFMTQPDPASLEGATVLKVMPIEGDFLVNGEPQKKFEEILSEIVISLELSGLRAQDRASSITQNFVHMQGSWCVQGSYPHDLLHLWNLYSEEKGSENDRPDIFPDSQLYVVLEFGHGGRDLESFVFNNARDLMAVFLQIAYSLAVAEEALEFEHRDLHWGNVLVASTIDSKIDFKLGGETYTLNTYGMKATTIDFTLSRIKLPHCIVFNNLAEDPSLFTSEGDYQFEVYRQMQQSNNNTWETFKPYTNVLWLHYLLVKMTSQCYIKNNKTKLHRTHHTLLTNLRDAMLSYESATHFVLSREA